MTDENLPVKRTEHVQAELVDDDPVEPVGPTIADEIEQTRRELESLVIEAQEDVLQLEQGATPDPATGTALVVSGGDASLVKRRMAKTLSKVTKTRELIKVKQERLDALVKKQARELERISAEVLGPLKEQMALMQEGIWTVNLYLGTDEEIVTLRGEEFEPAPVDTPVSVRQLVLAMDEECMVAAADGGLDGIDFRMMRNEDDFTPFDEWLLADPAHLEQVLPEKKGIVALRPRLHDFKQYEDLFKAMAADSANKKCYFLIRNGDRLYRISTDFQVAKHLIMKPQEFTSFFERKDYRGRVTGQLEPGTDDWLQAEKHASYRQRHYMRVALILQGLVDRTTVFHPLPEDGVSFLDEQHYLDGKVQAVLDDENVLGDGTESFIDWQRRLCEQLRPGLRIIGAFNHEDFRGMRYTGDNRYRYNEHPRLHPPRDSGPDSGVVYTLEGVKDDGFVFRYEREEKWIGDGWYQGEVRKPKNRASCVVERHDSFIIPFDLADEEDMRRFLGRRGDRRHYVRMFPVLKQALRLKELEAEQEAPFRLLLVGVLSQQNGVSVEEAQQVLPELVRWYKTANKHHRALTEDDAKAVRVIAKEHARRLAEQRSDGNPKMVAKLREAYPNALVIAKRRSTPIRYIVLLPERDYEDVFVRQVEYDRAAKIVGDDRWKMPKPSVFNRWNILYSTERWKGWDVTAKPADILTDIEVDSAVQEIRGHYKNIAAVHYHNDPSPHSSFVRHFKVWTYEAAPTWDDSKPITGKATDVVVHENFVYWQRKQGAVVLDMSEQGREDKFGHDDVLPWLQKPYYSHFDDTPKDERDMTPRPPKHERSLYTNEKVIKRILDEHEQFRTARRGHGLYAQRARKYEDSIEKAWVARTEAQAYDRFLADYHDPELWEGHRKQIEKKLRYPHTPEYGYSSRGYGAQRTPLRRLVDTLIEAGVDVQGMTVGQALAHPAAPPTSFDTGRMMTHINEDGSTYKTPIINDYSIPEDLHELVFDIPQPGQLEAGDEDEEDDDLDLGESDGDEDEEDDDW